MYLWSSELFPTSLRHSAMGLVSSRTDDDLRSIPSHSILSRFVSFRFVSFRFVSFLRFVSGACFDLHLISGTFLSPPTHPHAGLDVGAKNAYLLRHFILNPIILPRQARDKHRESTHKRDDACFLQARIGSVLAPFAARVVRKTPLFCAIYI